MNKIEYYEELDKVLNMIDIEKETCLEKLVALKDDYISYLEEENKNLLKANIELNSNKYKRITSVKF